MEVNTDSGKRLVIKENDGYVNARGCMIMNQDEIIKMLMNKDKIEKKQNKKFLLQSISRVPSSKSKATFEQIYDSLIKTEAKSLSDLVNESFEKYCEYIKYLDHEYRKTKYDKIEEISYNEPDKCSKKRTGKSSVANSTKHDEVSYIDRQNILLDSNPLHTIIAKDIKDKNNEYFICLYDLGKINDVVDKGYVIVFEPKDSFKYTKTAFFNAKEEITKEEFKDKSVEFLEYDRTIVTSLVNMTRHGHSTIEKFNADIEAIVFDDYKGVNPSAAKRLDLAKDNTEKFHQGSTVKVKKI